MSKEVRTRSLRYKRPALQSLGYDTIVNEIYEISEACSEVQWFTEDDGEALLNALDGDEDQEYGFRMAFSDLQGKAYQLEEAIRDWEIRDEFDDCTVGLIGNRYRVLGYDSMEEDYFSLTGYEEQLAYTESGKRLMRHTKAEMISIIGQCMGITLAFLNLRQSYDYLKATFDILRDENTSVLQVIKEIEAVYLEAEAEGFMAWGDAGRRFESLLSSLPDRIWLE